VTEPEWYTIAKAEIGVAEVPGTADNPRIQEYLRTCFDFGQHDEVAWCSAFVNWCLAQAGYEITHSALARSWCNYGERLDRPRLGAICVFSRGEAWQGHVGFFDSFAAGQYRILGGNQDDRVCYDIFLASKLVAIRWPGRLLRRQYVRHYSGINSASTSDAVELFRVG